jgi:hypothetical protein
MSFSKDPYLWIPASLDLQYSHVLFFVSVGIFLLYASGAVASVSRIESQPFTDTINPIQASLNDKIPYSMQS